MEDKKKVEREKALYVELPNLINKILLESLLPLPVEKEYILQEIAEIQKITNAECKAVLNYLKDLELNLD